MNSTAAGTSDMMVDTRHVPIMNARMSFSELSPVILNRRATRRTPHLVLSSSAGRAKMAMT